MIKRINRIKNFGVFENYRRTGDIRDFEEKNIIYGWNYSGKTTLSRLISYLDKNVEIEDDYKDIEFEVELEDGSKIDNNNRNASTLLVQVFNSDFVRDNLHFGISDKINGIKFAVGDTGNILEQIEKIDDYIAKAGTIISRNQINIVSFKDFESKFTEEARRLTELLGLGRGFTKTNIKNYVQEWEGQSLDAYVITDDVELNRVLTNAKAQNTGSIIDTTNIPSTRFESLREQVKILLKRQPQPSTDDELLSSDRDLYNWAKVGLELYNKTNPKPQRCAFCGGTITKEGRLAELNAYYSNEASKVKAEIEQLRRTIEEEKQRFENLDWSRKSDNDLTQSCRNEYIEKKQSYPPIKDEYEALLDVLISKLDDKYSHSLFVPMEFGDIDESANSDVQDWVSSVSVIFNQSNTIIDDFHNTKENAKNQYIKHYIAMFLINKHYRMIERKKDVEEKWIGIIKEAIKLKEEEKKRLSAQLESVEKGKEEMKDFIKLFLNREDLDITVTEDSYFILKRGEKVATHLSEGEKTAIAFSHFMVTLKSLKDENKLQNHIIFIDDPISSLDANHIAQVSALLNTFFFAKGLDSSNPEKVCNCFNQLFIATHNFELFSFLKDANNINRKKKIEQDGRKIDVSTCNYFMIKKIDLKKSTIINIPKSLSKYKSEYVYLFSEIDRFKNDGYPDDRAYMMPNIVRRFLEIYTLMKLPGNTDEIDNRIKILFADKIVELKILHNFSHFTSFNGIIRHNELIMRIQDIIDDLYTLLEKDPQHFNSLKEGIKNDRL